MKSEDRLSNLPNALQNHIVSFLPMKDAVRTSILSREWRDIPYSLSNLDLRHLDFSISSSEKHKSFVDFVDRILFLHDFSEFQNVRLYIGGLICRIDNTRSNLWIAFFVIHNVKVLNLSLIMIEPHRLPSCLFTCTSLTALELSLDLCILKLPPNIQLPKLKILFLFTVKFFDDNLTGKLFSSCPVLEQLTIHSCALDNLKILHISTHKLKELKLLYCYNPTNCKIKVSCPTLEHIEIVGEVGEDYEFGILSSLRSGKVLIVSPPYTVLKSLYNVTDLELLECCIEYLSMAPNLSTCLPTSFENLKTLNLSMWPTEFHVHVIILLITISPNLEDLSMDVMTPRVESPNILIPEMESVNLPVERMLDHLKKVTINDCQGSESELKLVKFLLENAKELKEMRISYTEQISLERQMEIRETLNTLSKSSSIAKVLNGFILS